MVYVPGVLNDTGSLVIAAINPSQLSEAVGAVTVTEQSALIVGRTATAGTGASVSFTVIVNVHSAVLSATSLTQTVTVVVPTAKKSPGLWLYSIVGVEQLSDTCASGKFTIAPHCPGSLFTTIFAGQITVGTELSSITTVCCAVDAFPLLSVNVQ